MITYLMQDLAVARSVAEKVNYALNMQFDRCIGTLRGNELVFGALYTDYNGHSCQMHIASFNKNWITKNMLFVYFYYPFIELHCEKILGIVPESNSQAMAFDERVGFKHEAFIGDVYKDGMGVHVLSMRRQDCKWIRREPPNIPIYKAPIVQVVTSTARH